MRDRADIETDLAGARDVSRLEVLCLEVLLDIRQLLMNHAEKHEALARRRVVRTRSLTKRGLLK